MMVNTTSPDGMLNNDVSLVATLPDRAGLHTGFGHPRHPVGVPKPANHEINTVFHRMTESVGLHLPHSYVYSRCHSPKIDHDPDTIRGPTIVVFQAFGWRAIFCYVLFLSLQSVLLYFCWRSLVKR
jgi:hypothetical protein